MSKLKANEIVFLEGVVKDDGCCTNHLPLIGGFRNTDHCARCPIAKEGWIVCPLHMNTVKVKAVRLLMEHEMGL